MLPAPPTGLGRRFGGRGGWLRVAPEGRRLLTMIRNSWGNRASVVDTATVQRYRDGAR